MPQASKIFLRNRALGYVSNSVPSVIRHLNNRHEHVVITAVGKSFHTYGCNHLYLFAVSEGCEEEITCLAADHRAVYTGNGPTVNLWKRGVKLVKSLRHEHPVTAIIPFGSHLIAVDEGNLLKVWNLVESEVVLELTFDVRTFKISALNHPSTYVNKVLLGSEQGGLQLWNVKSSKLVYSFEGWDSGVRVLEQAPALDVTAVGLNDGRIILHNLKFDKTLMEFKQDWGSVLSLSFRTDGSPILASSSSLGHITLWDLEEKKSSSQLLEVHHGAVNSINFLSNEPILVSTSEDNSVKMWIFDQSDGSGRLLRYREGHSAPPNFIRFNGSKNILSAAGDSSIRVFNLVTEVANHSLGRAYYNAKVVKRNKEQAENLLMPPVVEFSFEPTREKEWDNIIARHKDHRLITTWSSYWKRLGKHKLQRELRKPGQASEVKATCLAITHCGNFAVVGYNTGHVDRFNVQSGFHRCLYGNPVAHRGSVRGIAVDSLNQIVVSGCSEGIIKFWPFKPSEIKQDAVCKKPLRSIRLSSPISFFRSHPDSSLLCVILEDFVVCLLDVETKRLVRRLEGHTGPVTDAAFSPDARWVITSSLDSTIRTWDLPTSSLIDVFKVDSPCISLTMSPTGEALATAHVDCLGVYVWLNRTLFSYVSLRPIKDTYNVPNLELPQTRGVEEVIELETEDVLDQEEISVFQSVPQIEDLVTLSGLPSSRWLNLLDIDIIKKRNRPSEPPRAPAAAPFFLPTLPAPDIKFDFSAVQQTDDSLKTFKLSSLDNLTHFGKTLKSTTTTQDYQSVVDLLKTLSPASLDFEMNELALEVPSTSTPLLLQFVHVISFMFTSNRDYELAQAYLALFLKVHGETILSQPLLVEALEKLMLVQQESWNALQHDLMYCLCVLDSIKK